MNRYINAEWLCNELGDTNMDIYTDEVKKYISSAPSIDIIHCVECRYKGMEICPMYKLTKAGVLKPYDFCSYGEKENNGNQKI